MSRDQVFVLRLAALLLLLSLPCLAQVQSGRIVGTVTDPNKAVVANATVTVTNDATSLSTVVHSNGTGDYTVTPLNPGTYDVTITAPGFQTARIGSVEVQVNQSARADTQLQLGSTATTVQVTAAAPLLNTEEGALGTVVTNREIVNLPLTGAVSMTWQSSLPARLHCPVAAISFESAPIISPEQRSAVFAERRPPSFSMASISLIITRAERSSKPPSTISRNSVSCRTPIPRSSARPAAFST